MNNSLAGSRRSKMYSHPIDMIIIMENVDAVWYNVLRVLLGAVTYISDSCARLSCSDHCGSSEISVRARPDSRPGQEQH